MRSLIALGLTVCLAAPAAAQTEVIIRRPGQQDQVIRLDSARTRAAVSKATAELEQATTMLKRRLSELPMQTYNLKLDTDPVRLKTLALKDAEIGRQQLHELVQPLMRTIETARRQPHLGIVVFTAARPESDKFGAYINAVTPGSPADKAGIVAGDIIARIAGKSLTEKTSSDDSNPGLRLISLIATLPVGKPVDVELRRGSQTVNVKVTPNDEPGTFARIAPSIANIQRLPTDRSNGDIMLRTMPAMPSMGQQFEAFTNGNGDLAYAFGGNGLLANFELAPVNPKLGAYFGTSEGVLVVNNRMLEERAVAGGAIRGTGGAAAGGAAAGRIGAQTDSQRAQMSVRPREAMACDTTGGAGNTTIRCRGTGGTVTYLGGTPGMAVTGRRIPPVNIPLEPGDVIVSVDGRKVTSPSQLMKIVGTYDRNDEFKLQILRQKRAETVTVKIP